MNEVGSGPRDETSEQDAKAGPQEDRRRAYEPPRVVVKRSVAHATLLTVMGPTSTGLFATG